MRTPEYGTLAVQSLGERLDAMNELATALDDGRRPPMLQVWRGPGRQALRQLSRPLDEVIGRAYLNLRDWQTAAGLTAFPPDLLAVYRANYYTAVEAMWALIHRLVWELRAPETTDLALLIHRWADDESPSEMRSRLHAALEGDSTAPIGSANRPGRESVHATTGGEHG
jgi:hypothetical protein